MAEGDSEGEGGSVDSEPASSDAASDAASSEVEPSEEDEENAHEHPPLASSLPGEALPGESLPSSHEGKERSTPGGNVFPNNGFPGVVAGDLLPCLLPCLPKIPLVTLVRSTNIEGQRFRQ